MRREMATSTVALAGLGTSLATAGIVAVVGSLTNLNIFTFSIWIVLPVGAVACGLAAASGYYFVSKYLHYRPGILMLAMMVGAAALTQLLIYWLEYRFLQIGGLYISEYMSFSEYLDTSLTTAHIRAGRAATDAGPVGSFGYWLAAFQFVGFLVGSILSFLLLRAYPSCPRCSKYRVLLDEKTDMFSSEVEFYVHYDTVYSEGVGDRDFFDRFWNVHYVDSVERGTIRLKKSIYECPGCLDQTVSEDCEVFNGQDWTGIRALNRGIAIPSGVDIRQVATR